jgi:hypothetical protein
MLMPHPIQHRRWFLVLAFSACFLHGCARNPSGQPVNKAEAALDTALDCWARGEAPEALADAEQPIQATDPDWKAGYRLTSFLGVDSKPVEETPDRFRCRVALALKDPKGKEVQKEVVYNVTLGDTVLISRQEPK